MEALHFEHTVRLFLGEKAYNIAGSISHDRSRRRKWLRHVLRVAERRLNDIETTPRHRESMASTISSIREAIGKNQDPTWLLVDRLFQFIAELLGYTALYGLPSYESVYFQTPSQHYAEAAAHGDKRFDRLSDRRTAFSTRRELVGQLKKRGLSTFEISLVFGTSEWRIKQLLKE